MKLSTGEGTQMGAMKKDVSGITEGGEGEPRGGAQKGQVRERYGRGWRERGEYGRCVGRQPPWDRSWGSGREEEVGKRER